MSKFCNRCNNKGNIRTLTYKEGKPVMFMSICTCPAGIALRKKIMENKEAGNIKLEPELKPEGELS